MPQIRNDQMISNFRADFQSRYEPNFAWGNAVALHHMLPGLRGLWPMSSFSEAGVAHDLSTQARHLTSPMTGGDPPMPTATYGHWNFAPYVELDEGILDYLYRIDEAGLSIRGDETWIAHPGITIGAWVYFHDAIGRNEYIIAKQTAANAANCSYAILRTAAGNARVQIGNGGVLFETRDSVATMVANTWYHVVGRWTPSVNLSIFLDGVESSAGASAIATVVDLGCRFQVGAYDPNIDRLDGYVSLTFLCSYSLPSTTIQSIWQQTRAMFNK